MVASLRCSDMADFCFKANELKAAFFKLGFLDPTAVSLGMRFSEMLPTLWLKTGAKGKCPELTGEHRRVPDMLILPENQFAVLINENSFADFAEKLAEHPEIQTVFLATDYEVNYQSKAFVVSAPIKSSTSFLANTAVFQCILKNE